MCIQGFSGGQCHARGNSLAKNSYPDNGQVASMSTIDFYCGNASLPGAIGRNPGNKQPGKQCRQRDDLLTIKGRPALKASDASSLICRFSTPDYFAALRIPLSQVACIPIADMPTLRV